MLTNAVGSNPNDPLTSGCIVSPRQTGRDNDATPTQNPLRALPVITIDTFVANPINSQAVNKQQKSIKIQSEHEHKQFILKINSYVITI